MTSKELDVQIDILAERIKQLAERIKVDGTSLQREHETSTRNVLINPLLQALEWDTTDRKKVRTEYPIKSVYGTRDRRADYVLMNGEQPAALVEAKRLGEPLDAGFDQVLANCLFEDIQYMILTDGNHWDMYDLKREGRLRDKKVFAATVSSQNSYTVAREIVSLWYRSLLSGSVLPAVLSVSAVPAIGTTVATPASEIPMPGIGGNMPSTPPMSVPPVGPLSSGTWVSFNALPSTKGSPFPKAIRFAGGPEKPTTSWRAVFIAVAEWLVTKGVLTAAKCPIGITSRGHIVNTEPRHASGTPFREPHQLTNKLYLELNVGTDRLMQQVAFLLEECGQDEKGVQFRTG
ncbi:MAG: type I restriction enzyme HsdR N-terminal domain-containing protein [Chloroflexi bacterium]|nr:type I restriction enzyme HsdR N-terminal domain-containing protein [Chloroflexota bacterium]